MMIKMNISELKDETMLMKRCVSELYNEIHKPTSDIELVINHTKKLREFIFKLNEHLYEDEDKNECKRID